MDFAQNIKKDPVVLSVLPIHHTFELTVDNLGVLYCGATVCINDKIENVVANLNRFKPSVILVVPTIADVFYKKVMESISTGANKRKIAFAKKVNKFLKKFRIDARRKLYKKLLSRFGGNLTNVIVGGAPLRPEIAEAFDEFGINIVHAVLCQLLGIGSVQVTGGDDDVGIHIVRILENMTLGFHSHTSLGLVM